MPAPNDSPKPNDIIINDDNLIQHIKNKILSMRLESVPSVALLYFSTSGWCDFNAHHEKKLSGFTSSFPCLSGQYGYLFQGLFEEDQQDI
ncbi:hypothetical protein CU097_011770, partial [Rhizopus azygosporus]